MKRVAVIQFPGSNCEHETARAASAAGLKAEIYRWNRDPEELEYFDGFILPGGFSYQDRVRAGAVAAKKKLMKKILDASVRGKPVLGICNGAQVLVESGILPGIVPGRVEMALAPNTGRQGYYCNWAFVLLGCSPGRCAFTSAYAGEGVFPLPVAHAEGRFISADEGLAEKLRRNGQVVFRYASASGKIEKGFPVNPNGSMDNIAGLCNPAGNVLGLMPHPERALFLRHVPDDIGGGYGRAKLEAYGNGEKLRMPGPGAGIFKSMSDFLGRKHEKI